MATVVKNFRIKSGLIVEGTTGTINGQNILRETGSDSYILNLVGGATLVKSVEATQLEVNGAGKLSVKSGVFDAAGAAAAAQTAAEATASADATTKANAAASSAISAAATDATTKVAAEAALRVSGDAASVSTAAADATTKANAAQAAAEATAAAALSSAISTEVSNRNTAISTAVDSLVDGAPALLNTLNELAAAINDDANYTTTITTALGTKANSADVTSSLATAATNAAADATTKANAAQAAAEATVAAEATARNSAISTAIAGEVTDRNSAIATAQAAAQADAEATAASALADVADGTTPFTVVNVNDVSAIRAATTTVASAGTVNAITWSGSDYRTAKALVKFKNGVNTQVSEVLLTLDTSNNVSVTEFGSINTGTDLGTISAAYASGSVSISVTTTYASTDVMVHATLIK